MAPAATPPAATKSETSKTVEVAILAEVPLVEAKVGTELHRIEGVVVDEATVAWKWIKIHRVEAIIIALVIFGAGLTIGHLWQFAAK